MLFQQKIARLNNLSPHYLLHAQDLSCYSILSQLTTKTPHINKCIMIEKQGQL
jgi:hypothetical protein